MEQPADRLQNIRRAAGYSTASEAARHFGWNENTYRSHENGERGITVNTALRYAKAFRSTYQFLLTGQGKEAEKAVIPMRGEIIGRGKVNLFSPKEDIAEVKLQFDLPDGAYCYAIETDSMFPRYEQGDIVFMWGDDNYLDTSKFAEGVAFTADGKATFGVVAEHDGLASIEVVGAKPQRRVKVVRLEAVRLVVRDTFYALRIVGKRDKDLDPADDEG